MRRTGEQLDGAREEVEVGNGVNWCGVVVVVVVGGERRGHSGAGRLEQTRHAQAMDALTRQWPRAVAIDRQLMGSEQIAWKPEL